MSGVVLHMYWNPNYKNLESRFQNGLLEVIKADSFTRGSIFIDHATGCVDVHHQVSLSEADTIKAKLQFEREVLLSGVHVRSYHTDNGIFTSAGVVQELLKNNQTISLSGVGAAHQNIIAEKAIKMAVCIARTIMLHAAMKSPEGTITA